MATSVKSSQHILGNHPAWLILDEAAQQNLTISETLDRRRKVREEKP